MFGLNRGVTLLGNGLTDKQLFAIFASRGSKIKKKKNELKGDFCYKATRFLVYHDNKSRKLYFLSRVPESNQSNNVMEQPQYKPYETESENGRYRLFAYYDYNYSKMLVTNNNELEQLIVWLSRG